MLSLIKKTDVRLMGYFKEDNSCFTDYIDCYWETGDINSKKVYPSLPEPYINIFFTLNPSGNIIIKGISSIPDYLEINSKLFGVRLLLKGFLQLNLGTCNSITNKILDFKKLGAKQELVLGNLLNNSNSFEERIRIFRSYFKEKLNTPLSNKSNLISDAFIAILKDYENPGFINDYSKICGKTVRTILRLFKSEIGINTKMLIRIVRFHNSLSALHYFEEKGFYLEHGYFDQAHFIKEFKYFTGLSPEKYRKMIDDL